MNSINSTSTCVRCQVQSTVKTQCWNVCLLRTVVVAGGGGGLETNGSGRLVLEVVSWEGRMGGWVDGWMEKGWRGKVRRDRRKGGTEGRRKESVGW